MTKPFLKIDVSHILSNFKLVANMSKSFIKNIKFYTKYKRYLVYLQKFSFCLSQSTHQIDLPISPNVKINKHMSEIISQIL